MTLERRTHLLRLLFTDVGTTQHGGLDRGQNFQLSADGGNTLTHLNEDQEVKSKWQTTHQKRKYPLFNLRPSEAR